MCSLGSNWQYIIIGSDNGLVPNRRQAIIWTNAGVVNCRIYASLGLNELIWVITLMGDYLTRPFANTLVKYSPVAAYQEGTSPTN